MKAFYRFDPDLSLKRTYRRVDPILPVTLPAIGQTPIRK
jgi:hypothetical protein